MCVLFSDDSQQQQQQQQKQLIRVVSSHPVVAMTRVCVRVRIVRVYHVLTGHVIHFHVVYVLLLLIFRWPDIQIPSF